ncbi:MAG: hypothetical protein BRD44_00850 [Bacteroidetes bacterium QS_7_67_15]|nr:MAG: hypothetical protein BRD44_00850 [Bacteroidetes bacterium QS_7_67_15]
MHRAQRFTRYVLGGLFVVAGVLHFAAPGFYLAIMPPYLPQPRALVYISGAAEIAGGLGLLLPPPVRRWAGLGLIVLLLAVFPANVHMTHEAVASQGWAAPYTLATLARLPLQFVLLAVVWWAALRNGRADGARERRRP